MTLLKFKQMPYTNQRLAGLGDIMGELFENSIQKDFRTWKKPAANILTLDDKYEMHLAAPGLKREDFRISIEGDVLTIKAELKLVDEKVKFTHKEFEFSSFTRSFNLPDDIAEDGIIAGYEDGILKLTLPRNIEKSKTREIKIV